MLNEVLLLLCLTQELPPRPFDHGGTFHPRAVLDTQSFSFAQLSEHTGETTFGLTVFANGHNCAGECYVLVGHDMQPECKERTLLHEAGHTWGWRHRS